MSKYEYSNELANVVKKFLSEDDWNYSFDEDKGLFEFGLKIKTKLQKIDYFIDVKEDELLVYGIAPIGAECDDAEMMAQMAEFICRANYGIKNGGFELDFRDGEIRYKSFVDCDAIVPSTEVIENSVHCIAAMYKRYSRGIVDIIFAGSSAKKAIAKCEVFHEEELRGLLSELADSDEDMKNMLACLAERLDSTDDNDKNDEEAGTPVIDGEIRVNPFVVKSEGSAV